MVSRFVAVALAALPQLAGLAPSSGAAALPATGTATATAAAAGTGAASAPAAATGTSSAAPFDTAFARTSDAAGFTSSVALPAAALLLLAVVGLFFARRRARDPRLVQVMETTGLGSKRSLVVARIGSEILLLGVSESGISLLGTRPAPPPHRPEPASLVPSKYGVELPAAATPGRISSLLSRVRHGTARSDSPTFDACLVESTEDQELRRKLASGLAGHVPGGVR
jgi:flagellar protein FliO/FliZ